MSGWISWCKLILSFYTEATLPTNVRSDTQIWLCETFSKAPCYICGWIVPVTHQYCLHSLNNNEVQFLPFRDVKVRRRSYDWWLQGSGAWPYAGLSLLKVKESLTVIQMAQTLHTSANSLHVCIHKNVLTMFQQKLPLSVGCCADFQVNKLNFSVTWKISMFTNAKNKFWSLVMNGLADVDGF